MTETRFHLHLARGKRRAAKVLALALATVLAVGVLGATGASAQTDGIAGRSQGGTADKGDEQDGSWIQPTEQVFFPHVRDGFKDFAVFNIDDVHYENGTADIADENGDVVRSLRFGDAPRGSNASSQARWDGGDETGRIAGVGTYQAHIAADLGMWVDGEYVVTTVRETVQVRIASGIRNRAFTITRAAARTSRRTSGEGCRTRKIDRDLALKCRRGTSASASWRVRLPSRATKVRWDLVRDSASRRGGPGRRVETAVRKNRRLLVVTATVTRSRHQRYDAVVVRYHRRVRV
ncbi:MULTISPECIES: hypothetical protein [unclassified Nocardioides]|uniref:hypothetical protein n=1 Tax=unclassified Nocardioides TaxID=2615069 RepID=UPI00301429A4